MAAPVELNGIRLVDIGLRNGVQEMEIGETVDGSVGAGEPTRRSTCHFTVRIGCGRDGADRTDGVGQPVQQVCKYAL